MNKLLIISTHFAPDRHVGAKRMTNFAKYLPSYGWQPIVLTEEVSEYHGVDETLNQDLPANLKIYRVKEWHPFPAFFIAFRSKLVIHHRYQSEHLC